MAEKKKEILNGTEQKSTMTAIYDLVRAYPKLNGLKVVFEDFAADRSSLAIFTEPGAYIDRKFITGAFEGVIPFSLVYRASPNQDRHKISMIDFLEEIAAWLSGMEYPTLTENRKLLKIEAVTVASKDMADGAGDNDYVIVFHARYRKEI